MHSKIHLLFIALIIVLFSSCANIKAPMGGPDDETAPVVKKMTPANNTINYKGKTISVAFNENIDATKLKEDIIISPLINSRYDIVTKKNTVIIRFQENFKENTTYNINFGEGIKDLTKGNFTRNLTLAFSTGPYIDSLFLKGNAYNFVTGKGIKDLSIQVYSLSDTNTIRKGRPLYYAETNGAGDFTINNVKEGIYNIYALQDQNKDYTYDNEKESIAYMYNVNVNKSMSKLKFGLTKADTKAPKIISEKQEYEYYLLTMNEGIESYSLTYNDKKIISDLSQNKKTIRIFNTFDSKDSVLISYALTDSSGNSIKGNKNIFFEEYKNKDKKNTFTFSFEPRNFQIKPKETISLIFNKPIDLVDTSLIRIKKDTTFLNLSEINLEPDSTNLKITLGNTFTFKDSLVFIFKKGAFMSLTSDSSQAFKAKFKHKKEEDFGVLGGTIICKEPNYIFQISDSKGVVIDTKINPTKFYYTYLEPGSYELKIIIDKNKNGRWDPTDIDKDILPEPIKYYKEKVNLRANWELLDIVFNAK
ncbi:MAG TPA: Ig-like domain-containing domain [Cytophagaceae bacterium]|jgi:uncharacterized protein (DUF2141 family)|nr:Ig-like domain-containing domain [Cytophagaceae bacterium]